MDASQPVQRAELSRAGMGASDTRSFGGNLLSRNLKISCSGVRHICWRIYYCTGDISTGCSHYASFGSRFNGVQLQADSYGADSFPAISDSIDF